MTLSKSSSSKIGFNEDDRVEFRKQLYDIKTTVEKLIEEINNLKLGLKITKNNLRVVKKENQSLKQTLNLVAYKTDDLKQYGRRENGRIHGIMNQNLLKMMAK